MTRVPTILLLRNLRRYPSEGADLAVQLGNGLGGAVPHGQMGNAGRSGITPRDQENYASKERYVPVFFDGFDQVIDVLYLSEGTSDGEQPVLTIERLVDSEQLFQGGSRFIS